MGRVCEELLMADEITASAPSGEPPDFAALLEWAVRNGMPHEEAAAIVIRGATRYHGRRERRAFPLGTTTP